MATPMSVIRQSILVSEAQMTSNTGGNTVVASLTQKCCTRSAAHSPRCLQRTYEHPRDLRPAFTMQLAGDADMDWTPRPWCRRLARPHMHDGMRAHGTCAGCIHAVLHHRIRQVASTFAVSIEESYAWGRGSLDPAGRTLTARPRARSSGRGPRCVPAFTKEVKLSAN